MEKERQIVLLLFCRDTVTANYHHFRLFVKV